MTKTLVVTNDFPPRPGGIQAFVHGLAVRRPPGSVVVYAPAWKGAAAFDAVQPFDVVRHPGSLMLPEPGVLCRASALMRAERCDSVVFGAAAPLGLLAPALRRRGAERIVGITHGHEAGWASLPVARSLLRRIGDDVDALTYLGEYTRSRMARALSPAGAARMARLAPGVDETLFRAGAGGAEIRARHGLADRPVAVCVSRLVPRKGQDALIRAWPRVLATVPDAALLLVGGGPYRAELERLAASEGVAGSVVLTGSVPWEELPAHYDAGDVFAMPCRTRRRGLDVEGLGIVYLEASATGLPVVAGDSGGAPDAVLDGETGVVVPGRSVPRVADAVAGLLADPERAAAMGRAGRAWVEREWRWEVQAARLDALLHG
ncbi:GDP-mannose-dependent alpha-(1-6)-phosphatidylinositol monomannoside mannosyltransferase [Actinomadura sp. RB99]|uniref:glycosyltransferase family 4 protein n=1 Tax=Actinomadura sp. RB99 TaxID=2691577 RepID=UPI001688F659|nr:glycosyltransferase family 4 protein [Actinomadura sp. RB99]MBD2899498.1 GDP-mannose-dependent alpha-(1-6)-phosphatidylinositol monomannoside mannosyltransferase [Actinomadura sp. RB99]